MNGKASKLVRKLVEAQGIDKGTSKYKTICRMMKRRYNETPRNKRKHIRSIGL